MAPAAEGEEAELVVLNTCHIREKAAEKVYSDIGRLVKAGRKAGQTPMIAVAGCVAQAEGEEIMDRAPAVSVVVGPQAYHRLPEMLDRAVRGERGHRHRHARDCQVRRASRAPQDRPGGVPDRAGRLRQVLHLLRGTVHAWRRNLEALQEFGGRGAQVGGGGREGDHAAGPERQRVVGRGRDGPRGGPCRANPRHREDRRPRAHPLHHQPPRRHGRRADRRAWRGRES